MNRDEQTLKGPASDLLSAVRETPGIHFRELARAADISSMGQLRHHVDRLRQNGWIVEVEDGRYKRFFVTGTHPPALRQTLARFSRPVPLRIGRLLLTSPMSRGELRRRLGCADSTLGYHLARMCLEGDIVKTGLSGRCRYALADPEAVRAALLLRDGTTEGSRAESTPPSATIDEPTPSTTPPHEPDDLPEETEEPLQMGPIDGASRKAHPGHPEARHALGSVCWPARTPRRTAPRSGAGRSPLPGPLRDRQCAPRRHQPLGRARNAQPARVTIGHPARRGGEDREGPAGRPFADR